MKVSLRAALVCCLLTRAPLDATLWNHFLVPQTTFDPLHTLISFYNTSPCACKSECLASPACTGWTAMTMNTKGPQCLLTSGSPLSIGLVPSSIAVYGFIFQKDAIAGLLSVEKGLDGLAYHVPFAKMTHEEGRLYCQSIPGFRLAIFRTLLQFEDGKQMANKTFHDTKGYLLIDLTVSMSGTLLWGDGSLFPSSFASLVIDISKRNLCISPQGILSHAQLKVYVLCQGRSGDQLW